MVKFDELNFYFSSQEHSQEVAIPPLNTYLYNEDIHLKEYSKYSFLHILHPELNKSDLDYVESSIPSSHSSAKTLLLNSIGNNIYQLKQKKLFIY